MTSFRSAPGLAQPTAPPRVLRDPPELLCAVELDALVRADRRPRPEGWRLSPHAVVLFLLGGAAEGCSIRPKYFGPRRLIETAVATLATDRALLLAGAPGVGKSRVAEHLAAAISGASDLLIQGSAGTDESQLKYGWNYAELLARGPSDAALTPTPILRAMREGRIVRLEELTRIAPEAQDALLTPLSEKTLPIPELAGAVDAAPGFNLVATANLSDRGVNALSAALRRRFNVVMLPDPPTLAAETEIVAARLDEMGGALAASEETRAAKPTSDEIARLVEAFRDLRLGRATVGDARSADAAARTIEVRRPRGAVSTADAIAALLSAWTAAGHFDGGAGGVGPDRLADALIGAAARAEGDGVAADVEILRDYAATALAARSGPDWAAFRAALEDALETSPSSPVA